MGNAKRWEGEAYNGSDLVDGGEIGDAAMGEEGVDSCPLQQEVFLQNPVLAIVLVVIFHFVSPRHFLILIRFFRRHRHRRLRRYRQKQGISETPTSGSILL